MGLVMKKKRERCRTLEPTDHIGSGRLARKELSWGKKLNGGCKGWHVGFCSRSSRMAANAEPSTPTPTGKPGSLS